MKKKRPEIKVSEFAHQCAVMDWCNVHHVKYPALKWIYAIPNGGKRHIWTAVKLKQEGVKAGVPDLCLPHPMYIPKGRGRLRGFRYAALYIEMKTKGGSLFKDQKEWRAYLNESGYKSVVCYSADEAIREIEEYLNGKSFEEL